jgi:hypothetical protein
MALIILSSLQLLGIILIAVMVYAIGDQLSKK